MFHQNFVKDSLFGTAQAVAYQRSVLLRATISDLALTATDWAGAFQSGNFYLFRPPRFPRI